MIEMKLDREQLQKVIPINVSPGLFDALPEKPFMEAVMIRLLLKNVQKNDGRLERMCCDTENLAELLLGCRYEDIVGCMQYLDEEMEIEIQYSDGNKELIRPIEEYDLSDEVLEVKLSEKLYKHLL